MRPASLQIVFFFLFITYGFTQTVSDITFSIGGGCNDVTFSYNSTDATGRYTYQGSSDFGTINLLYSEVNSRWEAKIGGSAAYYNEEDSTPYPPCLDNGTWVTNNVLCGNITAITGGCEEPFTILYVKTDGDDNNDGLSWVTAYATLQTALANATSNTEIWVAQGTYYPDEGGGATSNSQSSTFALVDGVAIYGGFAGTESTLEERNVAANPTILSGDLQQNDEYYPDPNDANFPFFNIADNSFHVVTANGTTAGTILDGVTIRAGYAISSSARGGGVYLTDATLTLSNCTVEYNIYSGIRLYNASSLQLSNCTIRYNDRAGLIDSSTSGDSRIEGCTFYSNKTSLGGAMFVGGNSNVEIANCEFYENVGTNTAGAIYNDNSGQTTVTNCLLYNNVGSSTGAIYNDTNQDIELINCTLYGNSASNNTGGFYNRGTATVVNSILWENSLDGNTSSSAANMANTGTATVSYSLIGNSGGSDNWESSLGADGGNNLDADPLFTDAANDDFTLQDDSPAVNVGDNNANEEDTDLAGRTRIISDRIDLGAYESYAGITRFYVNTAADTTQDGLSWETAFADLQAAINAANDGDSIWVVAGTYYPTETYGDNSDQDRTFHWVDENLVILGGFVGNETASTQRNAKQNETILSGDIGISNDGTDNSYHVVWIEDLGSSSVLDGFTISGGNANNFTNSSFLGGGIIMVGTEEAYEIVISNCVFHENYGSSGGAIGILSRHQDQIRSIISDCTFYENSADIEGGGIAIPLGNLELSIKNCQFSDNIVDSRGGAISISTQTIPSKADILIENTTFTSNQSGTDGGAIYTANGDTIALNIFNCLITGNVSAVGGGISSYNFEGFTQINLINSTLSANRAYLDGGAIRSRSSNEEDYIVLNITNSIIQNNIKDNSTNTASASLYSSNTTTSITYSLVENITTSDANGNLDGSTDPLFINPASPSDAPTTAGDYRLQQDSPCINAGNNSVNNTTTDLGGDERIQDGIIDIGAYENCILLMCHRDADGDGYGDVNTFEYFCESCDEGYVLDNTDCNDDPNNGGAVSFPGNLEVQDGFDNDCDGETDLTCEGDELTLTEEIADDQEWNAATTLYASNTITSTGDVIYTAGETIVLQAGFQASGEFHAYIADCITDDNLVENRSEESEPPVSASSFSLFPNPASSEITVKIQLSEQEQLNLQIIGVQGRMVQFIPTQLFSAGEQQLTVNTSTLASGIYFVKIQTAEKVETLRFVVQHN